PNVIKEGENLNPVKTLRMRYDEWRKKQPALAVAFVDAQTPQRGAQPPGAPGGQPGGRGGGRGRGAIPVMTLTSSAWPDGGQVPVKYTQVGEEASPPLAWSNVAEGGVS